MRTDSFVYDLPEDRIAQTPIEPRDAARLLDVRTMTDHVVADLPDLLAPGDLLVVNDTKVRAARLHGRRRDTGGAVEVLLLDHLATGSWSALVRPARRLRAGLIVEAGPLEATLRTDPREGIVELDLSAGDGADVEAAIAAVGEVPLPPYIHTALANPERYQTTYARTVGSAAAPTAGLHLTERVFTRLAERDIGVASVELRVGLGTFRPISTETIDEHEMHAEWISVPQATVERVTATRRAGGRVVAVGTTVVRALESAARSGELAPWSGHTDLYITPGYRFRVVDLLMTNFHVPGSSLLVLVAALAGDRWRDAYAAALGRGYRFLSFGDAMLLERA